MTVYNTQSFASGRTVPPLLPDESVGGYLQRVAILTRAGALKPLTRELVGVKFIQARWLLPSHLQPLSDKLAPALPSGEQLLNEHTIYPAIRPFLSLPAQRTLGTRMLGEDTSMGNYFLAGLAHKGAVESGVFQAYCPECAASDVEAFGFAYWHRSHQIPYLATCGQHGAALVVGSGCCPAMDQSGGSARLPLQVCGCASSSRLLGATLTEPGRALDRRLSALIASMLTFDWPSHVERTAIGAAYRRTFLAKGYSRGAYMSPPLAAESFTAFAPADLLRQLGCQVRLEDGWFADAVRGQAPASLIKNALLIAFLYDDLNCFVDSVLIHGAQALPKRRRKPTKSSNPRLVSVAGTPEFIARRDDYRRRLTTWITTCADPSRTSAQRALGYVPMWLRQHDAGWYEETLPARSSARHSQKSSEFWAAQRELADRDGLLHVARRYEQLIHPSRAPVRITRSKLLDGLRNRSLPRPRTDEAMSKLVETAIAFKERLVVWILDNPAAVPAWPGGALGYAYARTHLPKSRIAELVAEAHGQRSLAPPSERR